MKKYILSVFIATFFITNAAAQGKGAKIGYIDMEYILEKVPNYAEAKNQLEQKAQKWKQEIEEKKVAISKMKETLNSEKVLLTKELLEEREQEIAFLDNELLDYQQKRFGPNGDLSTQKAVLVKPIQDQVFNIVQDIAEQKKYDFIFDRSSDLTMLFVAKRFDISDKVVSLLIRAEKKEQLTAKQLEKEAEAERKQDMIDDNPELIERQKANETKKEARIKLLEDRKAAAALKKQEADEKRKQLQQEREDKKNGIVSDKNIKSVDETNKNNEGNDSIPNEKQTQAKELKAKAEEAKAKIVEDRKNSLEERKKALEEKKAKILADREASKKAKDEERKNKTATTPKP